MSEPEEPACLCPLHDVTSYSDLPDRVFLRGDPTGSGCPIHETIEMRAALDDRARRDYWRNS
jgi:hypothetical protein